ncbi:MAG: hypothetical protein EBR87_03020, partial [Cytophagia bacterium]|nr:hypothetical protein [Cytophagia bacterium]
LKINNEEVGDINFNTNFDSKSESLQLNGNLNYKSLPTLEFVGAYFMKRERDNLEMELKFNNTDLGFVNGFMDPDVIKGIGGKLSGNLAVKGSVSAPELSGELNLQNTTAKIELLGVRYTLNGKVVILKDEIHLDNIPVKDEDGNVASLVGQIYHTNFDKWNYDLNFDFEGDAQAKNNKFNTDNAKSNRFLLLNTKYKEGDYYYGKAYGKGYANIAGYGNKMDVDVLVETTVGSQINFPMYGVSDIDEENQLVHFVSKKKKIAFQFIFMALIFAFPILVLLPLAPSIISLYYLDNEADWYSFYYLFKTPIFSFIYILLFIFELVFLTRIFQKYILAGRYSIYSKTYVIKWFLDALFSLSLNVIKPIFATVFISWIYKSLGAKVGKNTEISTATNVTHSLFEIGDESFIADDVVIGESEVRNQMLYLNKTSIGNRSFVGNSALIPQGYSLGDGMLIGVISVPPTMEQLQNQPYADWFGSPAKGLPNREKRDIYPAELTYRPHWTRKMSRGIIEFIRVLIPQSIILSVSILFIAYADDLIKLQKWHEVFLYFSFYYLGLVALPIFFFNLLLKWVLIGRYKKAEYPMWTWQVWRTEAITSMYESLTVPFLFEYIKGTPFLPFFFRLMGVKMGERVYMDSTDITEFDLVSMGDYCAINLDGGPQTHLFEDRVMKMGAVHIGAYSNIGARSVILYDTDIEENCSISALSLVMKGEKLPSKTFWSGIPIKN